jgi:hypothetical protein
MLFCKFAPLTEMMMTTMKMMIIIIRNNNNHNNTLGRAAVVIFEHCFGFLLVINEGTLVVISLGVGYTAVHSVLSY